MNTATNNAVVTTVTSALGVGGFGTGMVSTRVRHSALYMASANTVATAGTSVVKAAAGHPSFAGANVVRIPAWAPPPRRAPL